MKSKTMVLIHGAWQGSWAWDAWKPVLAARGWAVHAVDLPGNGCNPEDRTRAADVSLRVYADHVARIVRACGEPVVLVGHSGGGITASQVAEEAPECIASLVYLAGMMLPDGVRFTDIVQRCGVSHPETDFSGIGPHLEWTPDRLSTIVPPQAARDIFLHDCDAAAATRAAARLRPQPEGGRNMAPRLSAARYGTVPRIYVEALQDRSLRLPVQRMMQSLSPGARRLSIDCGHVPQLAQPRQLAELLCPLLEV
jgi:pimeloyl-ACP methyl ester carboxylesterase